MRSDNSSKPRQSDARHGVQGLIGLISDDMPRCSHTLTKGIKMIAFRTNKIDAMILHSLMASLALTLTSSAQQAGGDKVKREVTTSVSPAKPGDPVTCIQEAAKMNNATIKLAELAGQKADSADLKSFSQTLEKDHRAAQVELEAIARKR